AAARVLLCFFFQAEDGIRDFHVTGVQTCALPILGNDDAGYTAHHYEVTVIADVPLQVPGAGSDPDPTACPAEGSDAEQGFNNTSQLTDARGETEDDQACAPIPSIDITKTVSAGPTPNGDGTWTVTYDIVATNDGEVEG